MQELVGSGGANRRFRLKEEIRMKKKAKKDEKKAPKKGK
jgi:hypothetical protein